MLVRSNILLDGVLNFYLWI